MIGMSARSIGAPPAVPGDTSWAGTPWPMLKPSAMNNARAATFTPSLELLEYRRRKAAWNACFDGSYEEDEAWEARVAETGDAKEATIEAILARPCRSWQDVAELAEVVRDELWHTEDPDNWYVHSHHGDLEPALMKAIFAVAGGGANA